MNRIVSPSEIRWPRAIYGGGPGIHAKGTQKDAVINYRTEELPHPRTDDHLERQARINEAAGVYSHSCLER